ncbi:uncharacterized protein LOC121725294 [Aricia agestis]|uniref:uncharacterized protein LOC121725294 n=1 Tax=Aricia agestis TaxID=91739 RepID=UPI001C20999D|nr:uncharacterized protein LOC121725294 [Aricia agestis]XP_041968120.1 uncharacterized protein LOC121725294 [Aricia agestis]
MAKKTSNTSRVAAAIVIVVNFIVMLCCLVAFALSLWAVASPRTLVHAVQVFGTPALKALVTEEWVGVQVGVGSALLAAFFFCISLMGVYGAISASQFLLFMYAALVFLLLLLECALVFYFSSNIVEKGIQDDGQWTHALRLVFECCDKNYTAVSEPITPPWSCCGVDHFPKNCTADNIYTRDCQRAVVEWLQRHQVAIYASLAALHLLLSSCSLIRRSLGVSHSPS